MQVMNCHLFERKDELSENLVLKVRTPNKSGGHVVIFSHYDVNRVACRLQDAERQERQSERRIKEDGE